MCSSNAPPPEPGPLEAEPAAMWACEYQRWSALFPSHALRSRIVTLPPAFVDYLLADGVFLGAGNAAIPVAHNQTPSESGDEGDGGAAGLEGADVHSASGARSASSSSYTEPQSLQDWTELFPELHAELSVAIHSLGGKVVPKLNWSCPTDAVWVNPGSSLVCHNAEQVVLMLKSSDRVVHDLELLRQHSTRGAPPDEATTGDGGAAAGHHATLVLRKAYDLRPELEWRELPVVRLGETDADADGVPERHVTELAAGPTARRAAHRLHAFHEGTVRAASFPLRNYTFDAYLATTGAIRLLDFNPVGGTTSPLLFTWAELGLDQAAGEAGEDGLAATPAQHAERQALPTTHPAAAGIDSEDEDGDGVDRPLPPGLALRVLPAESFFQPGQRAVCSMPFDVLGLQDSVDSMVSRMQQQDGL